MSKDNTYYYCIGFVIITVVLWALFYTWYITGNIIVGIIGIIIIAIVIDYILFEIWYALKQEKKGVR